MTKPTCPITGEPLLNPGQTVALTALQHLRTKTNNLTALMQTLSQRLAGESRPEKAVPTRSMPTSTPPISLGLLDAIDHHRDTIETWAFHIMQHVKPSYRMPPGHDWHLIEAIYQQHLLSLSQWEYAPVMIDEVSDALHHLTRLENPATNPQLVDLDDIKTRFLHLETCREIIRIHYNRDLPYKTIKGWQYKNWVTPDARGRYLLADILHLAKLEPQDTQNPI